MLPKSSSVHVALSRFQTPLIELIKPLSQQSLSSSNKLGIHSFSINSELIPLQKSFFTSFSSNNQQIFIKDSVDNQYTIFKQRFSEIFYFISLDSLKLPYLFAKAEPNVESLNENIIDENFESSNNFMSFGVDKLNNNKLYKTDTPRRKNNEIPIINNDSNNGILGFKFPFQFLFVSANQVNDLEKEELKTKRSPVDISNGGEQIERKRINLQTAPVSIFSVNRDTTNVFKPSAIQTRSTHSISGNLMSSKPINDDKIKDDVNNEIHSDNIIKISTRSFISDIKSVFGIKSTEISDTELIEIENITTTSSTLDTINVISEKSKFVTHKSNKKENVGKKIKDDTSDKKVRTNLAEKEADVAWLERHDTPSIFDLFDNSSTERPRKSYVFGYGSSALPKKSNLKTIYGDSQYLSGQAGEDAFFVRSDALGVADGVGGWASIKGANPALYSRKLMHYVAAELERLENISSVDYSPDEDKGVEPKELIRKSYVQTTIDAKTENFLGSTTALIAVLRGDELRIANLGDCGLMIIRNMEAVFRTEEQQHSFNFPFQLGTGSRDSPKDAQEFNVKIEEGDIVILGTDGMFDNVFDEDVVAIVQSYLRSVGGQPNSLEPQQLTDALLRRAREVAEDTRYASCPFQSRAIDEGVYYQGGKMDDITVVVGIVKMDEDSPDRR